MKNKGRPIFWQNAFITVNKTVNKHTKKKVKCLSNERVKFLNSWHLTLCESRIKFILLAFSIYCCFYFRKRNTYWKDPFLKAAISQKNLGPRGFLDILLKERSFCPTLSQVWFNNLTGCLPNENFTHLIS